MKTSRYRTPAPTIGPTSSATLEQLAPIIIKPGVMRGCFGAALTPRQARDILVREWQACQADDCAVHLTVTSMRRGRCEIAGAGYLLDGELRFFVTPDLQRNGLGRALVTALIAEAEQRNLHELGAWVFPENLASARLLEACSFVPGVPMQVGFYERPVIHYRRSLDAAAERMFGEAALWA
jgi:RimJ/RimL family protein N-acetyltransferase